MKNPFRPSDNTFFLPNVDPKKHRSLLALTSLNVYVLLYVHMFVQLDNEKYARMISS